MEILIQQNPTDVALRHQLGDMYNAAGTPEEALARPGKTRVTSRPITPMPP